MFMNVSVLPSQNLWALCFNRIYETCIQLKSDWIMSFYILRHQMMHYPTVNNNVDLEFLYTPQCKVRNSSYEFAVLSKNKILRDFWETQSLKNGLNRQFWKKIASLWLRHLRFESLYLCQRGTRYSSEYLVFLLQKEIKDSKNRYYGFIMQLNP